jgi:hypothetical protein
MTKLDIKINLCVMKFKKKNSIKDPKPNILHSKQ